MFLRRSGRSGNSSEQVAQRGARASALSLKTDTFLTGRCPGRILRPSRPVPGNLDGEPSSPGFATKRLRVPSGQSCRRTVQ